ncbi:MAG: DUF3011 domain-containing protein [Deltaproteobacteria bacterium]|nr:DUF3011 domain-containing protein [Deltaproteobacteria bacterium]
MKKITLLTLITGALLSVSAFADHGQSVSITCQSVDFNYSQCDTGMYIVHAYLEVQLSNTTCVEGQTWGHNDRSIWVSGGCRGIFRVYGYGSGGYYSQVNINCASVDFNYAVCDTGLRWIVDSYLISQQSKKPCIQNSTWGTRDNSIWVNNGCRGVFHVTGYR